MYKTIQTVSLGLLMDCKRGNHRISCDVKEATRVMFVIIDINILEQSGTIQCHHIKKLPSTRNYS